MYLHINCSPFSSSIEVLLNICPASLLSHHVFNLAKPAKTCGDVVNKVKAVKSNSNVTVRCQLIKSSNKIQKAPYQRPELSVPWVEDGHLFVHHNEVFRYDFGETSHALPVSNVRM